MSHHAVIWTLRVFLCVAFMAGAAPVLTQGDRPAVDRAPGGTTLRLLIDELDLGSSAVSVGEMTFPAGLDSGDHTHGSIEIFYVVSGELEHVVNGQSQVLKPRMAGFVRPPDRVRHRVGTAGPATAVVIWVPGDEPVALYRDGGASPEISEQASVSGGSAAVTSRGGSMPAWSAGRTPPRGCAACGAAV